MDGREHDKYISSIEDSEKMVECTNGDKKGNNGEREKQVLDNLLFCHMTQAILWQQIW